MYLLMFVCSQEEGVGFPICIIRHMTGWKRSASRGGGLHPGEGICIWGSASGGGEGKVDPKGYGKQPLEYFLV